MARIGDALRALPSADAAEFYTSGRTSNEAAFLYQLFARAFGTNNFPDCSNMCHEATSVGLPESIGVGKGTVTLEDFDHCNAIFCFGHNPGTNHPRMLSTLRAAARRGAQIVVVNSLRERGLERFTSPQNAAEMSLGMSTSIATMYVQPRVGGDAAVLKGMMKALLETDRDARATLLPAVVDHDFIARHTLVVPAGVPAQEAVAGSYGLVFWGAVSPYSLKRGRVRAFENLVCIVHTSLQEATTAARERGTRGFSVFVQVAETRSFVAAGRLLGVSASAIGKSVARLEERLGVRLFHRSTRSITLTAEGVLFLERSRRILAEIEAAEQEPSQATAAPRGRLRVSLPLVSSLVLPVLGEFMREYPDIELDLDFTDQMVDVIDEGFDAVVRTGAPADSRLSARRLGSFQMMLVASPDYLARRGTPQVPADLRGHACLHFRYPNTGKLEAWPLRLPRGDAELSLPTSMVCNNIETRVCFALQGLGIACLPDFSVRGPLADVRLRHVLPDHVDRTGVFHVLWPASRHPSPKVRALVDFLCARVFPADAAVSPIAS